MTVLRLVAGKSSLLEFSLFSALRVLSAGPECDSEASGCPQFHFMPRFVRFLPGKTLNCSPFDIVSPWWSVVFQPGLKATSPNVSADAALVSAETLAEPGLPCSMVFIIDAHDGAAALWNVLQCFVMTAVLAYLHSIEKQFLPPTSPKFSVPQTKALRKHEEKTTNISDV